MGKLSTNSNFSTSTLSLSQLSSADAPLLDKNSKLNNINSTQKPFIPRIATNAFESLRNAPSIQRLNFIGNRLKFHAHAYISPIFNEQFKPFLGILGKMMDDKTYLSTATTKEKLKDTGHLIFGASIFLGVTGMTLGTAPVAVALFAACATGYHAVKGTINDL